MPRMTLARFPRTQVGGTVSFRGRCRWFSFWLILCAAGGSPGTAGAQVPVINWTNLAGLPTVAGGGDTANGIATFHGPYAMCVDTEGTLYVADHFNHAVRKVTPDGTVSTYAGVTGTPGTANGTGSAARLNLPRGIAVDVEGTVYVADAGSHTIRKIAPGGVVTTLAGLAGSPGTADGTGSVARFAAPGHIAAGPRGTIWVADTDNHTIRKVDTVTGFVSTVAGKGGVSGSANGTGANARFKIPCGIAWDGDALYVTDSGNLTVRRVETSAPYDTTTVAGAAGSAGSSDGAKEVARFVSPCGIAALPDRLFVTDFGGHTIRQIKNGIVSTVGGKAGTAGFADGDGTAATFSGPAALATGLNHVLYVADFEHQRISLGRVKPGPRDYRWSAFAGNGLTSQSRDGQARGAEFQGITGLALDNVGNLLVVEGGGNAVRRIAPHGQVNTLAGNPVFMGTDDGLGGQARFQNPGGIAADPVTGVAYVCDTDNGTIRRITTVGNVTTHAGKARYRQMVDGPRDGARMEMPLDLALLPDGSLAVVDTPRVVRRVMPDGSIATLAGNRIADAYVDATGTAAAFRLISGIAAGRDGTVYVVDRVGKTVRRIRPGGAVSTLTGQRDSTAAAKDGPAAVAVFEDPVGLSIDENGVLYVVDRVVDPAIRRVTPDGTVTTLTGAAENAGFPSVSLTHFGYAGALLAGREGVLWFADSAKGVLYRGSDAGSRIQMYPGNGVGVLFVEGAGFSRCQVQRAVSLNGPWTALGTFTSDPAGAVSFIDGAGLPGRAFYRQVTLSTR